MGEEAVDGAKLGTKLIMFVAIIGLTLVAFLLGKNLINNGVDQMETSVKAINESQFTDYDAKIVRGRVVKSAFSTFGNSEYAIVISTLSTARIGGTTADAQKIVASAGCKGACIIQLNDSGMEVDGTSYTKVAAINYNAQLAQPYEGVDSSESSHKTIELTLSEGSYSYEGDFYTKNGNVRYFMDQQNLTKKGQIEYIADSSSFNANLIKNESGDIMGIVFVQRQLK